MKGYSIKRIFNILIGIIGLGFSGYFFYIYSGTLDIKDLVGGIIFVLLGAFLILKDSKKMKEIESKKV